MFSPTVISSSLPATLPVLRGRTAILSECSNDFSLSATLAALSSLSLCNSYMLCSLRNTVRTIYHGKSSSNRVSKKRHQLWNNRIGGTPPFHCCSTSCYSLVPEMLTLTQYFVTPTSKQDFIYLFICLVVWHGSEGRLDSLYTHHCLVKNIFMLTF